MTNSNDSSGQPVDEVTATMVSPTSSSTVKSKPRRKRRPPAQPWRKPKDMPKRYLSAYNLFYKDERERMIKAGLNSETPLSEEGDGKSQPLGDTQEKQVTPKPELPDPDAPKSNAARKHARSSGIGFANLTRLVAAKWKDLDPALKAPYEEVAAKDKGRYQKQMVEWRAQQKKKSENNNDGEEENGEGAQWKSLQQTYSDPYSPPRPNGANLSQSEAWYGAAGHPRNGNLSPNHPHHNAGAVHVFGSPPSYAPNGSASMPATPRKTSSDKKSRTDGDNSSIHTSPPRPSSEPIYHRVHSFDSTGERASGYGYPPDYRARWETYDRYTGYPGGASYPGPYPPPMGMEGYPVPLHHRSMAHAAGPHANTGPDARYEMPYPPRQAEYAGYPAYYSPPPTHGNAHMHQKYSPPHYHPNAARPPYAYGFHHQPHPQVSPSSREETLQLHASRGDFQNRNHPSDPQPSKDEDPAKQQKHPSTSDSRLPASKQEDCSILESSFGNIDSNLDTDTVDFLTTLELE